MDYNFPSGTDGNEAKPLSKQREKAQCLSRAKHRDMELGYAERFTLESIHKSMVQMADYWY